MRNTANKDVTPEAGSLAEWRQGLEADELLSPGLRESYRRVLGVRSPLDLRTEATQSHPHATLKPPSSHLQACW